MDSLLPDLVVKIYTCVIGYALKTGWKNKEQIGCYSLSLARINCHPTIFHQCQLVAGKLVRNHILAVFTAELYYAAVGNRIKISFPLVLDGSVIFERNGSFRAVPSTPQRFVRLGHRPVITISSNTALGQDQEQKCN
jgi:hypothetical protein